MFKSFSLVATAALIAGAMTMLPALTSQVAANTTQPMPKADKLAVAVKSFGPACSQRAWPYYEAGCLRDGRQARIVATDRLPEGTRVR